LRSASIDRARIDRDGARLLLGVGDVETGSGCCRRRSADDLARAVDDGLPELPPMMSQVETKLNGVFEVELVLRSTQRAGTSKGTVLRSFERS
jgi:hypothetical protein